MNCNRHFFNQFQCICTSSLSAAFNLDAAYSIFLHFFTSHDYVYVADVECQVMFSLVTLYCFMCNICLSNIFRTAILI